MSYSVVTTRMQPLVIPERNVPGLRVALATTTPQDSLRQDRDELCNALAAAGFIVERQPDADAMNIELRGWEGHGQEPAGDCAILAEHALPRRTEWLLVASDGAAWVARFEHGSYTHDHDVEHMVRGRNGTYRPACAPPGTDGTPGTLASRRIDLTVPTAAWKPTDDPEVGRARMHATLHINGTAHHLEAWQVRDEPDGGDSIQALVAYPTDLDHLREIYEPSGHFDTTTIDGTEYLLVAFPHS